MRCVPEAIATTLALALALAGCDRGGDDGEAASDETGEASGEDGSTGDEGGSDAAGSDDAAASEWTSLEERPCPDDSFLTFENFGAIHLLNYCTGCHASGLPADQRQGAPIEVSFDDIEDVRTHAARIWARAADANATMPPVGGAPAAERALLGEWLACGAPTQADVE